MRLTLDWDSEEIKDLHFDAVRNREPAEATDQQKRLADYIERNDREVQNTGGEKWELWQSSGGEGYHYIEYDTDLGLDSLRQMRLVYGGDTNRVDMDGIRIQNGSQFPNVLYHYKNVKANDYAPYDTRSKARLLRREGFEEVAETKDTETGRIDYTALTEALREHPDFSSRAALFRRIQQRDSVDVTTNPSKRGYDIANGRRKPTAAEAKALRDYAKSRGIGHYGETGQYPTELAERPKRTTVHEYFKVPEIDLEHDDTDPFQGVDDDQDTESVMHPANLRTGTYSDDVDEKTVKQVHDAIIKHVLDILSPGTYVEKDDGGTEYVGLDLSRLKRAVSVESDRPLDRDEVARYRRVFTENQPGSTPEYTKQKMADTDPFARDEDVVTWEVIVYGEDYEGVWWLVRGAVDVSGGDVSAPINRSTIFADTEGWI